MFYLKQTTILTNLIIMSTVWLSTSFCGFLMNMLSNTFKDEYVTGIVNGLSEIVANTIASIIYEKLGVKPSIIITYTIATLGGVLILIWGLKDQGSAYFLVFFFMVKFGVCANFTIIYAANNLLFPTLFAATAMGICNFLARLFSSLSFFAENIEQPIPMIIFTVCCAATIVVAFFLRTKKQDKE